MPKTFRHLNEEGRDTLAILFNRGRTLTSIARFLGCSTGTLSREIRRNTTPTGYRPHAANRLAQKRFSEGHRRPRINHPGLKDHVEAKMRIGWSPEIIAGRLKRKRTTSTAPETTLPVVNHETIYQWVYADARHLIPSIYLSDDPRADLEVCTGTYLKEEIMAEGAVRNLPAFSRFIHIHQRMGTALAKMISAPLAEDYFVNRANEYPLLNALMRGGRTRRTRSFDSP